MPGGPPPGLLCWVLDDVELGDVELALVEVPLVASRP